MILQAIYRVNEGGEAKFALFLAQGLKLGQCARSGKNVTCTNRNFPGASRLVRGAFAALDEIFALSPERSAECELRRGDSRAGLDGSQLLLRRRLPTRAGQSARGGDSYVLTNLAGRILAVYRLGHSVESRGRLERPLAWKATFGEKQNYRFMPRDGGWIMDVSITRRLE